MATITNFTLPEASRSGPKTSIPHWKNGQGAMIEVIKVLGSLETRAWIWHKSHLRISSLASRWLNATEASLLNTTAFWFLFRGMFLIFKFSKHLMYSLALDRDRIPIFLAILSPARSSSYLAWLLVLSMLSLKVYVYSVFVGLMRTRPAPEPLTLEAPSV
ncbi:hypothetical protein Tco_1122085 [Tanacetum coccineum]|uniref:Uncharacterized protein n=1 Tax=Tanacetum coccineum TaxID=301880 RepID=A0ABQ5IZL0_9ASTR